MSLRYRGGHTKQAQSVKADYDAFKRKFEEKAAARKLNTDDVLTPPDVYQVVRDWAIRRYNLGDAPIVRPFWPGGDYERYDYPEGCVVIDNPPFSFRTVIEEWFMDRGIRFFLFAPARSTLTTIPGLTFILTNVPVRYAGDISVATSFTTNLSPGEKIVLAGTLRRALLRREGYALGVMSGIRMSTLIVDGQDCVLPTGSVQMLHGMAGTFGGSIRPSPEARRIIAEYVMRDEPQPTLFDITENEGDGDAPR